MEFEQMIQLIDHVSQSRLTCFQYEQDGMQLLMERKNLCINQEPDENKGTRRLLFDEESQTLYQQKMQSQDNQKSEGIHADDSAKEQSIEQEGKTIYSPLVGVFYAAPSEDAAPFVQIGDFVKKGQVLGIIEAMKLMNEIESECDGVITQICVNNQQTVEYGQPLFVLSEKERKENALNK